MTTAECKHFEATSHLRRELKDSEDFELGVSFVQVSSRRRIESIEAQGDLLEEIRFSSRKRIERELTVPAD